MAVASDTHNRLCLKIAVLEAAAAAHVVARPSDGQVKVGDTLVVIGPRSDNEVTVTKAGQAWITVSGFRHRFRRDTRKTSIGYGSEYQLITVEQHEYDQRLRQARERLRDAGIALSSIAPPPDGQIFAFAALADLLEKNED